MSSDSNKKIIYSYRHGDVKRGKLLFTEDQSLEKKYPNTFGISKSASKLNTSNPIINLPTTTNPDYKQYKNSKVIVIGNSPNVLKNEYGSIIDSYDIVIRINKCVTEGYEKYIGSKLDIWSTTHNWSKWYGEDYVPNKYHNIKQIWKRTPKTKLHSLPSQLETVPTLELYKSKFYRQKGNGFMNRYIVNAKLGGEPCTGLLTILTAAFLFSDVTIYGFSFFTESGGLVRDYYSSNKKHIHDTELEYYKKEESRMKNDDKKYKLFYSQIEKKKNIIKKLKGEGKIKILD
jgi:hypothetical protein